MGLGIRVGIGLEMTVGQHIRVWTTTQHNIFTVVMRRNTGLNQVPKLSLNAFMRLTDFMSECRALSTVRV